MHRLQRRFDWRARFVFARGLSCWIGEGKNIDRTHKSGFGSGSLTKMRQSIVLLAWRAISEIDWLILVNNKGAYQTRKVRSGLIGPFYFIWELNSRSEITRQTLVGGENQFKSQSENPPKPPWRGKTFADNTRFPVKTILTGKYSMNAIPKLYNHAIKPKRTGLPQFLRQSRSAFPH